MIGLILHDTVDTADGVHGMIGLILHDTVDTADGVHGMIGRPFSRGCIVLYVYALMEHK